MQKAFSCLLGLVIGSACERTPAPPPGRTPRTASGRTASDTQDPPSSPPDASPPETTGRTVQANDADGEPAEVFRSCTTDRDCVVVDRVGCCQNGWKAAIASSQRESYERSFACPHPHPMCAMYIVRDQRVAHCDERKKLCGLVPP